MTTIFDTFKTNHSNSPVLNLPHTDTWGPVSSRLLVASSEATIDINIRNEDKLTFSLDSIGKSANIDYHYPQPIDISKVKTIRFTNVSSVGTPSYNLIMHNTSSISALVSFENNGMVTWNLSEFTNFDLKNITELVIQIKAPTGPASGTIGELSSQTCIQSGNIIDILTCLLSDIFGSVKKATARFSKRIRS